MKSRIEERTQQIAKQIFAGIDTSGPTFFSQKWWDDWVMDWSMANEDVKVQMFRFIDVLPMLDTPESVAEHLQAYFDQSEGHFPLLVRMGAGLADPNKMRGRVVARAIRQNATRLARRFIAGTNPTEVLEAVKRLRRQRMTFTMDLLGEATVTEAEADDYLSQYLDLLETLCPQADRWEEIPQLDRDHQGPIPRVNLSLKLTALYSQCDPIDPAGSTRGIADRLRQIFRTAIRLNAFINLDMEQFVFKDLTIHVFKNVLMEPEFRDWPNVGIALQAYLKETQADLQDLLEWVRRRGTPVWVRLVKGAYWDYETVIARQKHWPVPVFTQKWQSDANFERCTTFLLDNYEMLRPAIASHNVRSMAHALAVAKHLNLPQGAFELQMLYGMADELKQYFVDHGYRLRIYTPFGKLLPGMAYLVRRLLENTSNTSFLRATFTEHTSVEQLIRSPQAIGHDYQEGTMETMQHSETLPAFTNEPHLDFSRAIHREQMLHALKLVRAELGKHYNLWIGGKDVSARESIESLNPAKFSEVIGTVASADAEQAKESVRVAHQAFHSWRKTSVWRRAEVLFQLAQKMRTCRLELAAWEVLECGKQWREADADVTEAIDFCEFYARSILELSRIRRRPLPGETNEYFYIPKGVCVVIAPWNFPLAILCGMTVAPLVAGNTVIIKPAEQSAVVGAKFAELLKELDLPEGVVNFLPGVGETVGPALVEHPDVSVITFTGSVPVGLQINQTAARTWSGQSHVKHVVAEMGGKNAIIIDDDADLDEAVKGVVYSAFGYQGQKCSACSRVIVMPRVYNTFVNRLRDAVASLTVGPPEDPRYAIGPVIDAEAFQRLHRSIERAQSESHCLFAGDLGELANVGYFIAPHLFVDVSPDSFLAQEELFGPVLAILRAKDLSEALQIANGTKYALTGGLFSRNPRTIDRVREEFLVGNLYINRGITGSLVDVQPFGGFKLSGIGAKAGGPDYLHHFLVPRTITENTLRRGFAPEEDSA